MFLRVVVLSAAAAIAIPLVAQGPAALTDLAASVERQLPALTETYKQLHRTPELSRHEEQTSTFVAGELRKLGYTVSEHVGKYEDGAQGFGVNIIPHTAAHTTLGLRAPGDAVQIEIDTLARYVARLHETA